MTTKRHRIEVQGISVEVIRKDIKNLHLGVYPPEGRVRVAAPARVTNDAVRLAVVSRLGWIKRQRSRFKEQERQTARDYVSRESHYFLGRRYLLNVVERDGPAGASIRNATSLDLFVPKGTKREKREQVLLSWYRKQMRALMQPMTEEWENTVGVKVESWGIKRMKTKWGSCNQNDRRIWLNLELIKKPVQCLEYIVVHELIHLHERKHNERFLELMNKFMPQWRLRRDELNRAPLAHETWSY